MPGRPGGNTLNTRTGNTSSATGPRVTGAARELLSLSARDRRAGVRCRDQAGGPDISLVRAKRVARTAAGSFPQRAPRQRVLWSLLSARHTVFARQHGYILLRRYTTTANPPAATINNTKVDGSGTLNEMKNPLAVVAFV